ncbi:hypothetical protein pEaSNUABM56_00233 [Erwinia phage pEa_SNUABM_56]|uniref:Uncharacterized protein n=1 Tax=Erwinia phage pEp_SNUABM_01 TaxID=2601643 RepID=A0A5J6DAU9_9CAUD|nr:hypothetical protein HWC63_gp169 [Erwinia phage pEp_SNUABM_01]QEQ95009.1 hypothetical protein pEpSNUABM01_183 [Erwinia phage pEp_SNUABM_01]UYL84935.1 hypothetical protein pEaSNUABM55_00162 [Erwinia phage pEa_SNUABM_55]UYL85253.1 hypothetical protein pEaSNUABM56_00233 [Erwinia phage pEa_SNUABM_56]
MEWLNLVLQPTVNLFAGHYFGCALVSMLVWAVIAGLTVGESDDYLPAGGMVIMFGLFTPIVLALAIILLPVLIVMLVVIALATGLVYGIKKLKDKALEGNK